MKHKVLTITNQKLFKKLKMKSKKLKIPQNILVEAALHAYLKNFST